MAKKHKKGAARKRSSRRRSSVGGIDVTLILSAVAGGMAAKLIDKVAPLKTDPKMLAGAKLAIGILAPMMVKSGNAKNIVSGISTGLIVVGGMDLLKSFGVLNGVDDEVFVSLDGTDLSEINGGDISEINGDDEELEG